MTSFKVGDKVRVKVETFPPDVKAGSVHVIDHVFPEPAMSPFVIHYEGVDWDFHADELELVTETITPERDGMNR